MDLTKILAISGKPGLYKNVGNTKTGVIVESLTDGKRFPAFAHERISSLAEISIFTHGEDVPLEDVFKKIAEKYDYKPAINPKSGSGELKAFMEEILPDYDEERVYASDIKKVVQWYNILAEKNMLEFDEEEKEEEPEDKDSSDNQSSKSKEEEQK